MAEGRTPPTREQLIAYIRKLEKRLRFLESELAEYKRSGESTNGLKATLETVSTSAATGQPPEIVIPPQPVPVSQPDKPPTFVIGKKPVHKSPPTPLSAPKAEMEEPRPRPEEPVDLGVGLAATPPEMRDIMDIDQEAPPAPLSESATYPHPQNEPVYIPIPDILPPAFKPGEFTRLVLHGEEEDIVDPMLRSLDQLKTCPPEERRNVFTRMTGIFWTAVGRMGRRIASGKLSWPKRLFMRFGIIDPDLLSDEVWRTLYNENSSVGDTGIYYLDEWLEAIYRQEIKHSSIDEIALQGDKAKKDASGEECLAYELLNISQMQRMVVGPRANLTTILTSDYCTPTRDNPLLTREWVYRTVKMLIPFDYTVFQRKYRGEDIEVKPLWLILPGYGTRAACWEPWSPGSKRTGPRLLICLFPPRASLKTLIDGLSDFRWTFAKEDAMHYWLTEGLTGKFLAMFSVKEQRQDMKALFRAFYREWILNEPRRVPKLDKRIREFFYHNCPYSDDVKQTLRGSGLFVRMIELEMAKREREEKEKEEIERIKAMREAKRAMRLAKLEEG